MTRTAFCLLILCLLVAPSLAADITITSAQKEYYFLTGQPVDIPLTATSSYPDTITGTLQFSIDEQAPKTRFGVGQDREPSLFAGYPNRRYSAEQSHGDL